MIRILALLLALAFGGLAACTHTPLEGPAPAPPPMVTRWVTVTVLPGATLYGIAESYRVPLATIIDANDLRPPYTLEAGQQLVLPFNTHTVQSGDTFRGIAERYGIEPSSLASLNDMSLSDPIRVGQALIVPARPEDWPPRAFSSAGGTGGTAAPATTPRIAPRAASAAADAPRFAWPADGPVIDGFGPKGGGLYNEGVDIAVREGDPVRAAADGVVAFAGVGERAGADYGRLIVIEHDDGWSSIYAHNRAVLVAPRETVSRGQVIASAGATGAVNSPRVHFEIRRGEEPVDPLRLLPSR